MAILSYMIDKDIDLEGITFRSPEEQDLYMAGQRERAIGERTKHPIVKNEAMGKARELLYKSAKSRERARKSLQTLAKSSR